MKNEDFELYNLEVSVDGDPSTFVCSHQVDTKIEVIGENLHITNSGSFSMYMLATLLPLLPAKQRKTDPNDWMTTDELIACPDPHCGAKFRISRTGTTIFKHSEVTKVPLKTNPQI